MFSEKPSEAQLSKKKKKLWPDFCTWDRHLSCPVVIKKDNSWINLYGKKKPFLFKETLFLKNPFLSVPKCKSEVWRLPFFFLTHYCMIMLSLILGFDGGLFLQLYASVMMHGLKTGVKANKTVNQVLQPLKTNFSCYFFSLSQQWITD